MRTIDRRDHGHVATGLAALASLGGCAGVGRKAGGHVAVVGGGYGGATVAKYLRLWSQGTVQVTLIERQPNFVSCPLSNLVIGGAATMAELTIGYDRLQTVWGVRLIRDEARAIDPANHRIRLAEGGDIRYDRLVLAPGIDFMWQEIPGLDNDTARSTVLHAWRAGPQTVALRKQLTDLPDGGIYAIAIPKAPYRCPPGPYERACLVAHYFKQHKPRSKVIILDANPEVVSKKALFAKAWSTLYPGIVEYRPNSEVKDIDAAGKTAVLEFDTCKADVLNVIPPQKAGDIAGQSGLRLINGRWVDIDWLTMEASDTPGVHVLGDAVFPAPAMPKSGHLANQHGKLAAAAILRLLAGDAPSQTPLLMNTCYSFVDPRHAMHVASVHRYDPASRLMQPVPGAGGLSVAHNETEGLLALGWAKNIWADTLS